MMKKDLIYVRTCYKERVNGHEMYCLKNVAVLTYLK